MWSGRGGGGGGRVDTVVERACQLQSLSHIGFYEQKRGEAEEERGNGETTTSPLTLGAGLPLSFWRLNPCVCAGLSSVPTLGRSVGLSVQIHWSLAQPAGFQVGYNPAMRSCAPRKNLNSPV